MENETTVTFGEMLGYINNEAGTKCTEVLNGCKTHLEAATTAATVLVSVVASGAPDAETAALMMGEMLKFADMLSKSFLKDNPHVYEDEGKTVN